jgi:hypothetical protein
MPPGGSSSIPYSATAWVGIDGMTCGSAILQTGVDFNVTGSTVSYDGMIIEACHVHRIAKLTSTQLGICGGPVLTSRTPASRSRPVTLLLCQ